MISSISSGLAWPASREAIPCSRSLRNARSFETCASSSCPIRSWVASGRPATSARASSSVLTIAAPASNLNQRHLRHRATARRGIVAVTLAGRLAAPRRRPALGLDRDLLRLRRHRAVGIIEAELFLTALVLDDGHTDMAAGLESSEQYLVSQRLLDAFLDDAGHRPRAHLLVIAVGDQPLAGFFRQLDGDVAVAELRLELHHELLDHLGDDLGRQVREGDDG